MNFALLLLILTSLLTPERANWCRMIFLGATDHTYSCLIIHRTQPGNYYTFSDSVYIAEFSNSDNALQDIRLIHAMTWTKPNGHRDKNDTAFTFDIAQYLWAHDLRSQFPSDDLDNYNLTFQKNQLYLRDGPDESLLIDSAALFKAQEWLLQKTRWMTNEFVGIKISEMLRPGRVTEYFGTNRFYYFLIRTGSDSYDANYLQFIVPVPRLYVGGIIKEFQKK